MTEPGLIHTLAALTARERGSVSIVTQRIVTHLIRTGELERHIRRTRRNYAARRATMLRELDELAGVESVTGHAAGLHVVVKLCADLAPSVAAV